MTLFPINKNPSDRQLIVFGLAWLVFLGLLGWESWAHGRYVAGEIAWILAGAVPLVGLLSPGLLRLVYLALSYATYPIGFVVSRVLLALVYYLALKNAGPPLLPLHSAGTHGNCWYPNPLQSRPMLLGVLS